MATMAERRARVSRSIDRVAGERVRVIPMTQGGGYLAGVPDPEKPPYEVEAVVSQTSRLTRRDGNGAQGAESIELRATSFRASFGAEAFETHPRPVKGWRIQLLEREGAPTLQVSSPEPPDAAHGRLIVHLARI